MKNIMMKLTFVILASIILGACSPDEERAQYSKDEIGQIASQYIIEHPQILLAASRKLQQQQKEQQIQVIQQKLLAHRPELTENTATPNVGPQDAKVIVIEFFDYQCSVCKMTSGVIAKAMENNPKVRFIFKDFPIFASRWESSGYSAEMGMYIFEQRDAKSYLSYHNAIYASPIKEGQLTKNDVDRFARTLGIDLPSAHQALRTQKWSQRVRDNLLFGSETLGLTGTPTLAILPRQGANEHNTTVIPGYAPLNTLQQAIDKARR